MYGRLRRRAILGTCAALAATATIATTLGGAPPVQALGDDGCLAVRSGSDYDPQPTRILRPDGSQVGLAPPARTISQAGLYADVRRSTEPGVPDVIVVGDLDSGTERTVYQFDVGSNVDGYLARLRMSPDSTHMAFIASHVSGTEHPLVVIDLDGDETLRTPFDVWSEDFAFSPDGSQIVYAEDSKTAAQDIWVADADGSTPPDNIVDYTGSIFALPPYFPPQNASNFQWSPDGDRIVYDGRNGRSGSVSSGIYQPSQHELYMVNADGTGLRQLTTPFKDDVEVGQDDPVWSPDGSKIAYSQTVAGNGSRDSYREMALYDVATDTVSVIPNTRGIFSAPQGLEIGWSDLGDAVIFTGSREKPNFEYDHGIYSVRPDGSQVLRIDETENQPIEPDLLLGLVPCDIVPPTAFSGLTPSRLMDTRDGTGVRQGLLGSNETISLDVTGAGGVPPTGVDAVALNVTVTRTSRRSYLSVYPSGVGRPTASNLNWDNANVTKAGSVIVKVGSDGKINFYNFSGTTHVIADVAGWFSPDSGFTAITPERVLDTREPLGVPTARPLDRGSISVGIHGPIVPTTATGVIMTVTAAQVANRSYITVYGDGRPDPGTSNLNLFPGVTSSNVVFSEIGGNGRVVLANPTGSSHVIADIAGYLDGSSGFEGQSPVRVLDTRTSGQLGGGRTLNIELRNGPSGAVPATARVAVLNVTALRSSDKSFLTVYPGSTRPTASNVNFDAGATVPNLVIVPIGSDGTINIYNDRGSVDVLVDVLGWFS